LDWHAFGEGVVKLELGGVARVCTCPAKAEAVVIIKDKVSKLQELCNRL
jgi:hypothetical protein